MKIKCIIFDCDGLMFDTERLSIENWHKMSKKHNFAIPDGFFIKITGATREACAEIFTKINNLEDCIDDIRAQRMKDIEIATATIDNLNKKGLIELLTYLNSQNYLVAIASSSEKNYVQSLVDHMSFKARIDYIVAGSMIENSKPAPDIFLNVATTLNLDPSECLVLEDSKNGLKAAYSALMPSIFIQDTVTPDEEMKQYIKYQLDDLSQVINFLKEN